MYEPHPDPQEQLRGVNPSGHWTIFAYLKGELQFNRLGIEDLTESIDEVKVAVAWSKSFSIFVIFWHNSDFTVWIWPFKAFLLVCNIGCKTTQSKYIKYKQVIISFFIII